MKENPYSAMAGLMAEAGRPKGLAKPIRLLRGTVLSADPLKVDVAGTVQEAERFYISHRLLNGHEETVSLKGGAGGFDANGGTHKVSLVADTLTVEGTVMRQAEPVLKPQDEVLLLTEDDQYFYLIDKVVKAG